jgi:uncharacterized membrane protein YqjE
MMPNFEKITSAAHNVGDLFSDLSDLFGKEMRLASAELKQGFATLAEGVAFFAVAAVIALFAVMLLLVGIVHFIASFGLALHWSYLLVAVLLFVAAGVLAYLGRAKASPANLIPKRTLVQLGETARTIKEQIR